MGSDSRAGGPLTEQQRRLVRENIGLVAVHLRRNVSNLSVPRRDREWEDLFQEGCLGLIQAAVAFRQERGIPFAAFALPRIHNAVSRGLQCKFATVYVPPKRAGARIRSRTPTDPSRERKRGTSHQPSAVSRSRRVGGAQRNPPHQEGGLRPAGPDSTHPTSLAARTDRPDRPKVHSLSHELQDRLADPNVRRDHDPTASGHETISERLRGKYERAVREASDVLSGKTSTRGDRDKLVRVLVEERFLVPHEESRTALRQVARQTQSSYARVAQCDKQLGDAIRNVLEADPEFRELRRRAKSDPRGAEVLIDDDLERDLADTSADEFARRLGAASALDRAHMLDMLLNVSDGCLEDLVRGRVSQLPMPTRELLLRKPSAISRQPSASRHQPSASHTRQHSGNPQSIPRP